MELAIVLPVYNEENSLPSLLYDINDMLSSMNIQYTILAINNLSTDRSEIVIKEHTFSIPFLQLIQNDVKGHGPSILKGYELSKPYEWVFQFDSDYQYDLNQFKELWEVREHYDLLIAEREIRDASFARNFITAVLRRLFRSFYGGNLKDINSPFRLIRGHHLQKSLSMINPSSFAPNTLISAYFVSRKLRIYKTSCFMRKNILSKKSMISINIFMGCFRSISSLIFFRIKV